MERTTLLFPIVLASIVGILLFSTVALTTPGFASGGWLVLLLHYPLFWLLAWLLVARLPRNHQLTILAFALPLIILEAFAIAAAGLPG